MWKQKNKNCHGTKQVDGVLVNWTALSPPLLGIELDSNGGGGGKRERNKQYSQGSS